MDIARLIATGILTAVCVLIIREQRADIAALVGVCGGVVMLLMIVGGLAEIVGALENIAVRTGLSSELFKRILKIVGIGYLTEFAANICEDSGSRSVADKIQLGGKVLIMITAIPIVTSIVEIVISLLP